MLDGLNKAKNTGENVRDMNETAAIIAKSNNQLNTLIEVLKAKGLSGIGITDLESITSTLDKIGQGTDIVSDASPKSVIATGVAALFLTPLVVSGTVAAITTLFTGRAAIGALVAGLSTLFSTGTATAAGTGIAAATGAGAASGTNKFLPFLKKAGWIGTIISAGLGVIDPAYKKAGYSGIDRAGLGVADGFLNLFDMGQNATAWGLNKMLGTTFKTSNDLSGAFKNWATSDRGQRFLRPSDSFPEHTRNRLDSDWRPRDQRIQTNNMAIPGLVSSQNGAIYRDKVSDAVPNAKATLEAMREANRLNRKILEAIENQ